MTQQHTAAHTVPISKRLRQLREDVLKFDQAQMGRALGFGREYINRVEREQHEPSEKFRVSLEHMEMRARDPVYREQISSKVRGTKVDKKPSAIREEAAAFSRTSHHGPKTPVVAPYSDSAPDAVARAACEEYLRQYLDRAERIPDALAHAIIQLRLALPMSKLDELEAERKDTS